MIPFSSITRSLFATGAIIATLSLLPGCANFRRLATDLKMIDTDYRIIGVIHNADDFNTPVRAAVVEWDQACGKVSSGDLLELAPGGTFGFMVKNPRNQHVVAFADTNRNKRHDNGEPSWIHRGPDGKPAPVTLDANHRQVRVSGSLSRGETLPPGLRSGIDNLLQGRTVDEVITRRGVKFSIGEVTNLDDPRFTVTRGEDGLWTPATVAIQGGFGIYFLEPYDPAKIPVLFIHGAGGSPQDWRTAMELMDRRRYQAWFYFYPSGGRLHRAATALDEGIGRLHGRYHFRRLHVVAHSMGGLVARDFITRNVFKEHHTYINTFITFSTPWAGHEAASMGVKWAPSVVPSWRDVHTGSDFLDHLFDEKLKGKVSHHLFYSHRASRSPVMPAENDGSVSVASQLRPEARADATTVQGYDEDHMSILSSPAPLKTAARYLKDAPP